MLSLFRSPLGVDFGTSSLKVVQLKGKTVPIASIVDLQEQQHDPAALGRTIDASIMRMGLRGTKAVVNTPGAHTFIRTVMFPRMPERELKDALMWEVKRQLPYRLEDAVFDYVSVESGNQVAVTYAASEKQYIEDHIAPLKAAGLEVVAVDVNPLCIMRTIKASTAGNTLVIDIGSLQTEIHIIKNGVLRITRTVGTGSDFMKRRLVEDGISASEADRLLREGTQEALGSPLSELYLEVFRSIDYYKATFKEASIAEMIITGGPSANPAVGAYLADKFNLPVKVNDPFEGLKLADEGIRRLGPLFSVAVGLARRAQ